MAGSVYAVLPDGRGGWFIGGEFSAVGGHPRANLAHILANYTVADWSPDPQGSPFQTVPARVSAMAQVGDTLYVGGIFTSVSGEGRQAIAAVDVVTGRVLPWAPELLNASEGGPSVSSIATMGDTVFVGGSYEQVGGAPRTNLVALSARTGTAFDWQPQTDYYVNLLRRDGPVLYVAGGFSSIGGQARSGLAAVDSHSGEVLPWNPTVTRPPSDDFAFKTMDLACGHGTVYLAGRVWTVNGEPRSGLAAVDSLTGALKSWNPAIVTAYEYPLVAALALRGDTLYLAGWFSAVNGQERLNAAAISVTDGTVFSWNPRTDEAVWALAAGSGGAYLGGSFTSMGDWQIRYGLAALDLTTGRLKEWNPSPNGYYIYTMALSAGTLYVGGYFTEVGGQSRSAIAALDTLTGAATPWNPSANEQVRTLVVQDGVLYAGGSFTSIGGQVRRYVAALDTATGLALPWNPDPNSDVDLMLVSGNSVYLGGWFTRIGGVDRSGLGAVDATTGVVTEWNPRLDPMGILDDMALLGHKIYACGQFTTMGDQDRNGLAAVDDSLGAVLDWNPAPYGRVWSLAASGHTVFAGGEFLSISGQPRLRLAAVDAVTGNATDWAPGANSIVSSMTVFGNALYVGGAFGSVGGLPTTHVAAISIPEPPPGPTPAFALWQCIPNPARTSALVRFSLLSGGPVTLDIYDVQGRRIATPLRSEFQSAGPHEVVLDTGALRAGVYFYRMETGRRSATRKMLVVR